MYIKIKLLMAVFWSKGYIFAYKNRINKKLKL